MILSRDLCSDAGGVMQAGLVAATRSRAPRPGSAGDPTGTRRLDVHMNAVVRMTMLAAVVGCALLAAPSSHARPARGVANFPGVSFQLMTSRTHAGSPAGRPARHRPIRPARHAQRHALRRTGSRGTFVAVTPRATTHAPRSSWSRASAHAKRDRAPRADACPPESRGPPRASPHDPLAASLPARREAYSEPRARLDATFTASPAPVAFHRPRRSSPAPPALELKPALHARAPPP